MSSLLHDDHGIVSFIVGRAACARIRQGDTRSSGARRRRGGMAGADAEDRRILLSPSATRTAASGGKLHLASNADLTYHALKNNLID